MPLVSIYLLIASIILIVIMIRSIDLGKAIINYVIFKPPPVYFELFPWRLSKNSIDYLIKNDVYYRNLNPRLRRSFNSRIKKFIASKRFIGRGDFKLNSEIILIIASAAVKISFGLREFLFPLFHTIIIYSDEFYSNASHLMVKGETNATGVVVFSWKDFKQGNSDPFDSINLGYHEFAHALFLTNLMNPYENDFKEHYREWLMYVKYNSKLKEATQKHIFREYAAANEMEFFAVAVENFFEKPKEFKQGLPNLYKLMSKVLNQDTLNPEQLHLL